MQALLEFRRQGKKLLFVTNNASKSRRSYVSRFCSLGLDGVAEREVVSSSYAAAAYLHSIGFKKKVFLIGNRGVEEELRRHGIPFVGGESATSIPFLGDTDSMLGLKASDARS
jgi:phosphoglycolate phosphatase